MSSPRRPLAATLACLMALADASAAVAGLPVVSPGEVGMSAERLDAIDDRVAAELEAGQFAGCVVAIGRGNGLVFLRAYGDRQVTPERQPMTTDTVFDLASLTKPIATGTSVAFLVDLGRLRLSTSIQQFLPEVADPHGDQITVEHLLTHHAGYVPDNPLDDFRHGVDEAWRRLFALEPRDPPGTKFVYSDVGFELLGEIVERVDGRPLDRFARDEVFLPLGMTETGYLPPAELRARAAASEERDGRMLVGEVHDPRAALLGGVAGHAGLFSTASDLAVYAAMMLGEGRLPDSPELGPAGGVRVLSRGAVREFTRPRDVSGNLRAAGLDVRSRYSSNRSDLYTDRAFGHGGFTGTAMWIDPGWDLFVIVLSNRLHPDGKGSANDLASRIGSIAVGAIE